MFQTYPVYIPRWHPPISPAKMGISYVFIGGTGGGYISQTVKTPIKATRFGFCFNMFFAIESLQNSPFLFFFFNWSTHGAQNDEPLPLSSELTWLSPSYASPLVDAPRTIANMAKQALKKGGWEPEIQWLKHVSKPHFRYQNGHFKWEGPHFQTQKMD